MSLPQKPLHYSPTPLVWHRRRRTHRVFIITACIMLVALLAAEAPTIRRYIHARRLMHRLLTHTDPPGTVAFETDPKRIAQLSALDVRYAGVNDGYAERLSSADWAEFDGQSLMQMRSGVAFCHEMISHQGKKRLVVVEAGYAYEPFPSCSPAPPNAIELVTSVVYYEDTTAPRLLQPYMLNIGQADRVFTGSIDPNNPSHIIIPCQDKDGKMHTINGWLDSNDQITFDVQ